MNVNIGLSILGAFIGALGGSNLGLQSAFNRAKSITFKYAGVREDSIDALLLEEFVRAGAINQHIPPGTVDKLIDDEIYVITPILKTNKIVVAAKGEADSSVQLDVPVIQQAVGGTSPPPMARSLEHRVRRADRHSVCVPGGAASIRRVRRVPDDRTAARRRRRGAGVRPGGRGQPRVPDRPWRFERMTD